MQLFISLSTNTQHRHSQKNTNIFFHRRITGMIFVSVSSSPLFFFEFSQFLFQKSEHFVSLFFFFPNCSSFHLLSKKKNSTARVFRSALVGN